MSHYLDRERGYLPWPRVPDRRPGAPVDVRLGEMKEQVEDAFSAGELGEQRGNPGRDGAQRAERREQRREEVLVLVPGCLCG
jgi:hypothetical protein